LKLPDYWPVAELPRAAPPVPKLNLPDSWPVAEIPAPKTKQVVVKTPAEPRVVPGTFQVLVYRPPSASAQTVESAQAKETTIVVSPPQATPPAPKHLTAKHKRERFTWESPEMYVEGE
jgi:hypothetical protein